jgi:predicted ABC-class ATPase
MIATRAYGNRHKPSCGEASRVVAEGCYAEGSVRWRDIALDLRIIWKLRASSRLLLDDQPATDARSKFLSQVRHAARLTQCRVRTEQSNARGSIAS